MSDSSEKRDITLTDDLLEYAKAVALKMAKRFRLPREVYDDAVQEAHHELHRRPVRFDPAKGGSEKTLIYTVVERAVLKFVKDENETTTRFEPTDAQEIQEQAEEWETGERRETWTLGEILQYIDNDDNRALCELVVQCKGNISEAARQLGLTEGTVRKRLRVLGPKLLAAGFDPFSIGEKR